MIGSMAWITATPFLLRLVLAGPVPAHEHGTVLLFSGEGKGRATRRVRTWRYVEVMTITPRELAQQLGIDQKRVRRILRKHYRPNGENSHARWMLDDEMVDRVRKELGK